MLGIVSMFGIALLVSNLAVLLIHTRVKSTLTRKTPQDQVIADDDMVTHAPHHYAPQAEGSRPAHATLPAPMSTPVHPSMEDDLFDAASALLAAASTDADKDTDEDAPVVSARGSTDVMPGSGTTGTVDSTPDRMPPSNNNMGWRDIVSDLNRNEASGAPDREDIADELIQRLQTSGVLLPATFRPTAKRKIAEAARQGERQRRAAIMEHAGRQVDRISQRLREDRDLQMLAREFIALEAEDALYALEQTQNTSRNASPRLAAYLLLDAAPGASAID